MKKIFTKWQQWFNRRKLWQKLLILYLSISSISTLVLCTSSYIISVNLMKQQVSLRLSDITQNMSRQIQERADYYQNFLDSVAYDDSFLQTVFEAASTGNSAKDLNKACMDLQDTVKSSTGESVFIRMLLSDNENTSNSIYMSQIDNKILEDVYSDVKFKESELFYFTANQDNIYVFRRIINPYDNRNMGTIVLYTNSKKFFNQLKISNTDEYAFVLQNADGENIYTETHLKRVLGTIAPHAIDGSKSGEILLMHELFLYEPYLIKTLSWNLCLLIPKDILFAGFSDIISFSLIFSGICVLIMSLFSVLISISFSKRINNICSEMTRVGSGKLEINLKLDENKDEIGYLTTMFNEMITKINTLIIDRAESEIKQKEAQLNILQAQINPHFLYNCMDTINWRAIINGDEKTSDFATNLSEFYRTSLNKGNMEITLKDEIKNIRAYLLIQQDLHDNSFDVLFDVDETIYQYKGINLMLQPLVENAIVHGIEKDKGKRGQIKIEAKIRLENTEEQIIISIFNTGPSISSNSIKEIFSESSKGYGLSNVNKRIQLHFGQNYGVDISPVTDGTVCRLIIPAIPRDANGKGE